MNHDEYLWDGSGEPDPAVVQLEQKLSPLRYQPPPTQRRPNFQRKWVPVLALATAAAWFLVVYFAPGATTQWRLAGQPLRVGQTIQTQAATTVAADAVGSLTVERGSRLRLTGQREFALEKGTVEALIWAPPGSFVINTPAAKAVDLGCRYTLQVGDNGDGLLTVQVGWVAFQAGSRESLIPAGAACRTYFKRGPGTPYQADSPETFRNALDAFDRGDSAALPRLLNASRPADALTLWHLLPRTTGTQRGEIYDRLAGFVILPPRDAILRGDEAAITAAWNALGYGDTEWWRSWKQSWPR